MQKITSLLKNLKSNPNFNGVSFYEGDDFRWDHTARMIYYSAHDPHAEQYLLHEAGHCILGHNQYAHDVELVAMERDAWQEARSLASDYSLVIDDDVVEESLNSYRDWLHARSTCPKCTSVGIQSGLHHYSCLACHSQWTVNEARSCALRRYTK